jgi:hypothetical protein
MASPPPPRVRVGVRVRPSARFAQANLALDPAAGAVTVRLPRGGGAVDNRQARWDFAVDAVLPNASQDEAYAALAADAVGGVLAGRSATLIAYGCVWTARRSRCRMRAP